MRSWIVAVRKASRFPSTELRKCKDDAEAKEVGVEWCIQQCKDLIAHGVPSLHFYTMMASDSVYKIAKEIY